MAIDPEAEFKALLMETKRCILYIIRVQSGSNLMEIMVKPITAEDDDRWRGLVREELSSNSRKRGAYSEANTLLDLASMTYAQLKRTALENIIQLEQMGRLTRHNNYQDLLNAIAVDIRTKHRRRVQRQRELEGVRLTLNRLTDQANHLDKTLKTYNDYIEQAMVTLQKQKGKKRFLMPFSKQWNHERELSLSGRTPKFGSYKYSAADLAGRGVLAMWQGYSDRQWNQLDLTFSSNEVGKFSIEGSSGSITMPGASSSITLDDLLQAQYNGTPFLEFFDEGQKIRMNVNAFLGLIMKKFYKDG
jgi:Ras GTPase-activating-like protein IQGAP2/3